MRKTSDQPNNSVALILKTGEMIDLIDANQCDYANIVTCNITFFFGAIMLFAHFH